MRILVLSCFFTLLAMIGWSDFRTRRIPDYLVLLLAAAGACSSLVMPETGWCSRAWGMLSGGLPLLLCAMIAPGSIGGGDIKLMAGAGIFLGYRRVLIALLLGIFGGGIYSAGCVLTKRMGRKARFALGPFLCTGIVLSFFFGDIIWNWLFKG